MLSSKMTVYFLQHNLSYPNLYKEAYIHNIWISGVRYFLNVGMKYAKSICEGNSEHFCFLEINKWNHRNTLLFQKTVLITLEKEYQKKKKREKEREGDVEIREHKLNETEVLNMKQKK